MRGASRARAQPYLAAPRRARTDVSYRALGSGGRHAGVFLWGARLTLLDVATLTRDAVGVCPESLGVVEHSLGSVEPPEQNQRPRLAEHRAGVVGSRDEQLFVLSKRLLGLIAAQSDGRQAEAILQRLWVGVQARAVRLPGCLQLTESEPDEPEPMPRRSVAGISPDCLREPRFRQLQLAPTRCAKASRFGSERVVRRDSSCVIVGGQRLLVAMCEFLSVTQLHPRNRAVRRQDFSQPFGLRSSSIEAPNASIKANQLSSFGNGVRMRREVLLEHADRL